MQKLIQSGFTLIELVIVIMLIGILASVAVPRFFDIASDAHDANLAATASAFTSAVNISHAKWLSSGQPTVYHNFKGVDYLGTGNSNLGYNSKGWPVAANTGKADLTVEDVLDKSSNGDKICAQLISNLLSSSSLTFGYGTECEQSYCAKYQENTCTYTYQKNMENPRRIIYKVSNGSVTKEFP